MQYSCHPIKGKNVSREKKLAKKEFAVTFFPYCLFLIYCVQNIKFILCCNNLSCNLGNFYLFLDSALSPAKLNLLCCINISLTTP